jgi:hypothetical protein
VLYREAGQFKTSYAADQAIVRPMIEASAARYAEEKGLTLRSGMSFGTDCK